jgi:SPP1 family predicted phage head-tail adaptor
MARIGDLDKRVQIIKLVTTQDESGAQVNTWEPVAECWAALAQTPGSEAFASGQRSGRVPTVFRLRVRNDVRPAMRLVWADRTFNIESVVLQRRITGDMMITAEELVEEIL